MTVSRTRILLDGLRAALCILLLPCCFVLWLAVAGKRLPPEHRASASGIVQAAPDQVWATLTQAAPQANWRHGPLNVMRDPQEALAVSPCWVEGWRIARLHSCQLVASPGRVLIVQTEALSKAFSATWTYTLQPGDAPGTTHVDITEQSRIEPRTWRAIGQYLLRRHTAAQQLLTDLQAEAVDHPR